MGDREDAPVLICGLGAFGQAVLARLLPFEVSLKVLDLGTPDWPNPAMRDALEPVLTRGDMRRPHVLRHAGVEQARAVLLLSADSGVNIEAALQVRLLNASATIVVRSDDDLDQLGSLLEQRLPGLVVVNPLQLSAGALVQALRPGLQLARFEANGEAFEVRETPLEEPRFQRPVRLETNGTGLVVMAHTFCRPQPDSLGRERFSPATAARRFGLMLSGRARQLLSWLNTRHSLKLALVAVTVTMAVIGLRLFAGAGGWVRGLFVVAALLKGDYVDPTNVVLGPSGGPDEHDAGLVLVTLLYSLVGTLLSSALVAVILDQLLVARFGGRRRRRLPHGSRPILLVGGGALAGQVARTLQREGHLVVRVETDGTLQKDDTDSLFVSSLDRAEALLKPSTVRGVALLSGELLTDLQDTLQLQNLWPEARFALLALSEAASDGLGHLLGGANLISPIELGADVVVATAFGERVEGVLRIRGQTLLQVRYRVSGGDTLVGRTVTRLDHGYGLTVLSLLRHRDPRVLAMPSPGTVVAEGDQIMVLASLAALRRVEQGRIRPPNCVLTLQRPEPLRPELALTLQQSLARHLGLSPANAVALVRGPGQIRLPVDPDCGALLVRDLQHQGIQTRLQSNDAGEKPTASTARRLDRA